MQGAGGSSLDPNPRFRQKSKTPPWPRHFNSTTLPQYDGEFDPVDFLLKYEAVVESNDDTNATKAKALIMALKGWRTHGIPTI